MSLKESYIGRNAKNLKKWPRTYNSTLTLEELLSELIIMEWMMMSRSCWYDKYSKRWQQWWWQRWQWWQCGCSEEERRIPSNDLPPSSHHHSCQGYKGPGWHRHHHNYHHHCNNSDYHLDKNLFPGRRQRPQAPLWPRWTQWVCPRLSGTTRWWDPMVLSGTQWDLVGLSGTRTRWVCPPRDLLQGHQLTHVLSLRYWSSNNQKLSNRHKILWENILKDKSDQE